MTNTSNVCPVNNLGFLFAVTKIAGFTIACIGACLIVIGPYLFVSYAAIYSQLLVLGTAIFLIAYLTEKLHQTLTKKHNAKTEH